MGRVKVQVKTLSEGAAKSLNYAFKDDKFLSYCEEDIEPVPTIFVGVDSKNGIAYWLHIDHAYVSSLGGKKTIALSRNQFIKTGSTEFIDAWADILDGYARKFKQVEEVEKVFKTLNGITTPSSELPEESLANIHIFLDSLNSLMEEETPPVKGVYFPGIWKIGLAYSKYTDSELEYVLYPIPYTRNDIQVKKLDKGLFDQIRKGIPGSILIGHSRENPIEDDPKVYAKKVVGDQLERVLDLKLLNHTGSKVLATEFICAFIDKFQEQLGLENSGHYPVERIAKGFNVYVPIWVEETTLLLLTENKLFRARSESGDSRLWNLSSLEGLMNSSQRSLVREKVNGRMKRGEISTGSYPLHEDEELPIRIFEELLRFIMRGKAAKIDKMYRGTATSIGIADGQLSMVDIKHNLTLYFRGLKKSYETLTQNNFPALRGKLKLWGGANRIFMHLETTQRLASFTDVGARYVYLKDQSNRALRVDFIDSGVEWQELHNKLMEVRSSSGQTLKHKGTIYRAISFGGQLLSILDNKTPIFVSAYELLQENLNEYLMSDP